MLKHKLKIKALLLTAVMTIFLVLPSCSRAKEEINLSLWASPNDMEYIKKITDNFIEQYSDKAIINITISEENEVSCRETVLANPQAAADVYSFAADQFESLYRAGTLLPITLNTEKIIEANGGEASGAVRCVMRGNDIYAYPATASNGYFLYYNSKYYTQEDIKSLDKILEIAKENSKKFAMDFSSGWYIYSFFKGAGLNVNLNDDGITNSCNWNTVSGRFKGIDVAQAMLDIASNEGFKSTTDEEFIAGVKDGSIIAGINGTWNAINVSNAYGENYAAAKLPLYTIKNEQVQMRSFAGYKLIGVNANTKNPEWAMRLAEWITNEENQLERFRMRGEGPSNANAAQCEEVLNDPAISALSAQSEFGYLQDVSDAFWSPTYIFGTAIAAKNADGIDLQELLNQMTADITAVPDTVQ